MTELRVLTALEAGDSVLIVPHLSTPGRLRCVLSSDPDVEALFSYSLVMKLERRGLIQWAGEQELVLADAGREALAQQPVDPTDALVELDVVKGLPKPRLKEFLEIMRDAFNGFQRLGMELTPELIQSAAVEAAEHVRSGGSIESFTAGSHIPKGSAPGAPEPVEDTPVVLKSNSSPVAGNQFRRGSSLRRNYGRAKHKR